MKKKKEEEEEKDRDRDKEDGKENNITTVRLPYDIEEKLDAASKTQNRPKSEFVREALTQYFVREETEQTAWEVGEPYFGNYGSGDGNLSVDYKNRLKDKIRAKTAAKTTAKTNSVSPASMAAKNHPR
jgi:predicted DNA-binding protein